MNNPQPIFDCAIHYRIEVGGRMSVEWLKSIDSTLEIRQDETRTMEAITVLDVHTDQAGIVGLVRRLHGLGVTILQLQVVADGGEPAEAGE